METFALYLFKSAVWLTGFTLVYMLFLRNERFFLLKRYYLIAGILISFIFPVISIHYQVTLPAPAAIPAGSMPALQPAGQGIQPVAQETAFRAGYVFLVIYLSGLIFLIVRSVREIRVLFNSIDNSDIKDLKQAKVIRTSGFKGSFSFFNYVFINPSINESELEMIMNHELVHVSQRHWFDLLLAEIVRLLQWVNPFAWIYTGLIRQNHEYIADAETLQQISDPAVYKAVLLNQLFDSRVFSLSDTFNFSINKKRFDMMKKIAISPYRKLKVLLVLPVFAVVLYAFAKPDYHYSASDGQSAAATIYSPPPIIQKEVKGTVRDETGKPLEGVYVMTTGRQGQASMVNTSPDGSFKLTNVADDATINFMLRGYTINSLKPDFSQTMAVTMKVDPDYKPAPPRPPELVVVDGTISEKSYPDVVKDLGNNLGTSIFLPDKEATDKYGEKGANGAIEIMTRKKALELGIKTPFPRHDQKDFPTFQGKPNYIFNDWVNSQVRYPEEAKEKKIHGWVVVNFTVELDGTLSSISPGNSADPLLTQEVIRVVKSSPKWDPPENKDVDEPYRTSVTVSFQLPDIIGGEEPFIVVEEMPMYPGGDGALLKYIAENTNYPEEARALKIEGKVIVRFIVTKEGNTDGISIIKGVNPLLDNEAVRVVGTMKGFSPGTQGGKPVPVWYMVPVNFVLPAENPNK
jgi:TonB family protein